MNEVFGIAEDRSDEIDGYNVSFTTLRADMDLAPLLKGLPDDMCQCPHWGYAFKGRIVPRAEAGREFIQFSPADALQVSVAAMAVNMQGSVV